MMKKRLTIPVALLIGVTLLIYNLRVQATTSNDTMSEQLYAIHSDYREATLTNRRFKQSAILPLIEQRKNGKLFAVEKVGTSVEGRTIQLVKTGTGKTKVLLWSQMHGDEPTATMALFDIFNFLEGKDDGLDALRNRILQNTSLYFVPMLNPDGAEKYERRNAQGIDLNRDALALQAPESRILRDLQHSLQPEFGFNLHDQSPRYSVGRTNKVAAITFLATAYDYYRSINEVRKRAMQLVTGMNRELQRYIPNQVARYNDTHEPRGFGDNVQKWGTTLVLIESGGYVGDPEKQYLRKLNFVAILSALDAIATKSYEQENYQDYEQIPENANYIYDLIVKGVTVNKNGLSYKTDIGINRNEINYDKATKYFYKSTIVDYGDLSTNFGSAEIDASGLTIAKGKVFPTVFENTNAIHAVSPATLLKQGYLYIRIKPRPNVASLGIYPTQLPFHILRKGQYPGQNTPQLGDAATFLLKDGEVIKYAVVNGFVYDLSEDFVSKGNGLLE